jgi:hypothetical protein
MGRGWFITLQLLAGRRFLGCWYACLFIGGGLLLLFNGGRLECMWFRESRFGLLGEVLGVAQRTVLIVIFLYCGQMQWLDTVLLGKLAYRLTEGKEGCKGWMMVLWAPARKEAGTNLICCFRSNSHTAIDRIHRKLISGYGLKLVANWRWPWHQVYHMRNDNYRSVI